MTQMAWKWPISVHLSVLQCGERCREVATAKSESDSAFTGICKTL